MQYLHRTILYFLYEDDVLVKIIIIIIIIIMIIIIIIIIITKNSMAYGTWRIEPYPELHPSDLFYTDT